VDPTFGTGALGVTPAHSHQDWEIAQKNNLPVVPVINEFAKMTDAAGSLMAGKKVLEAREATVAWLRNNHLLLKEEAIKQNISTSERTGAVIEPLPKLQWWIQVDKPFIIPHSEIPGIPSGSETTLKKIMKTAVESGAIDMSQEGFRSAYFHWIDNLRDWCISRQIWFGHRIPVWYSLKEPHTEIFVGIEPPVDKENWHQEEDVLDTWFSSALWTFSTLGWPEKTRDLETFHPTSLMSPAYEILYLWVSRMILMSGFHLGQVPFKKVLIHGLVRAKDGRKFSKSLNNGVDPLEIIEKYGTDALRMGLVVGSTIGSDTKFDEQRIRGYKLFANKLWNITRFVLENALGVTPDAAPTFTEIDAAVWAEFEALMSDVTLDIEEYRIYMAAEKLYHYVWDTFASSILEESKPLLKHGLEAVIASRQQLLLAILRDALKLLHPFMPFVTEEIWSSFPDSKNLLMIEKWPA
jgi:valyl-tRNA synthetase